MIRVPVKKQKSFFKKVQKAPLKLECPLPSDHNLDIVKLAPSKQLQKCFSTQQRHQLKPQARTLQPMGKHYGEKGNTILPNICRLDKELSALECYRNKKTMSEQQQLHPKAYNKLDEQKSSQIAQESQKNIYCPENESIQFKLKDIQNLKPNELQRKERAKYLSLLGFYRPRSSLMAVCRTVSETFSFKIENNGRESSPAGPIDPEVGLPSVSSRSVLNFSTLEKRKEKERDVAALQFQIQKLEARLGELKQEVAVYEQQCLCFGEEIVCRRREMKEFLAVQPNKILRSQAQGYKESEQMLFDIASDLEYSSYEGMLEVLSSDLEVPEASFFYAIDSFQKDSEQTTMAAFRQKLKSIYENILGKAKEIIKRLCGKIQKFVHTMRNLASYTIGKREYLNGINSRMAQLTAYSDSIFADMQSRLGQPSEGMATLRQIMENCQQAYTEAQIFY